MLTKTESIGMLFGIIILVINGIVLVAAVLNPKLRTVRNAFLISLTTADFLVGFITVLLFNPYWTSFAKSGKIYEYQWLCRLALVLLIYCPCMSIFNIFGLTLERYIAVYYPFRYESICSRKRVFLAVLFCWMLSVVTSLFALPGYEVSDYCPKLSDMAAHMKLVLANVIIFSVAGFALMYFIIWREIQRGYSYSGNGRRSVRHGNRHKIVIFMVLTFAMCWIPKSFVLILQAVSDLNEEHPVNLITTIIASLNSLLMPFLLVWRQDDFRQSIRQILLRMWLSMQRSALLKCRYSSRVQPKKQRTSSVKVIVRYTHEEDSMNYINDGKM